MVIWLSLIDYYLYIGSKEIVKETREEILRRFECDDIGEVAEYLDYKADYSREEGYVKLTQPVLFQNFEYEFDPIETGRNSDTPALARYVLSLEVEGKGVVNSDLHAKYHACICKLLHVTRWTRLATWNSTREHTLAIK